MHEMSNNPTKIANSSRHQKINRSKRFMALKEMQGQINLTSTYYFFDRALDFFPIESLATLKCPQCLNLMLFI